MKTHSLFAAAFACLAVGTSSLDAALETAFRDRTDTNGNANGEFGTWNYTNLTWDSSAIAGSVIAWGADHHNDDAANSGVHPNIIFQR